MVRSHPTHNRTRLWPLTTCMGFGFGITRQFLQHYKSGSLSQSVAQRKAIDDDCSLGSSQVNVSWRLSDTTYTMDALVRSLSLPTLSDSSYCPKHRPGSRSALSHSSVHPLHPPPTNLWSFTTTGSGGSAYRRPAGATAPRSADRSFIQGEHTPFILSPPNWCELLDLFG